MIQIDDTSIVMNFQGKIKRLIESEKYSEYRADRIRYGALDQDV
jgi:hypothetical protein